jgi:hypothetical protein
MVQEIRYWDVFPKSIRGFRTPNGGQNMTMQLVLCGDPVGVMFESSDEVIAEVTGAGVVTVGMKVGYAELRVYEPEHPEETRKVHVQVLPCPGTDVQSIGAANEPGEDTGRYAGEKHVHQGLTQFGTDVQTCSSDNSAGTRDEAARVDHKHKIVWLEYTGP